MARPDIYGAISSTCAFPESDVRPTTVVVNASSIQTTIENTMMFAGSVVGSSARDAVSLGDGLSQRVRRLESRSRRADVYNLRSELECAPAIVEKSINCAVSCVTMAKRKENPLTRKTYCCVV